MGFFPAHLRRHGIASPARGLDDPNLIYLVFKINSVEEANTALNMPARKALMEEAKITGPLELYFGTDK